MAQAQGIALVDNNLNQDSYKDSPDWVVIADDWVDIDHDNMEDDDEADDDATKNNEFHDHVTSPVPVENKNKSEPKVMTSYIDVPEEMVKFFKGKDIIMDLQLASGAMIHVPEIFDKEAKGNCRAFRLIGNSENISKAEKLIKLVVALDDAGGTALLRKDDCDTNDYYRYDQKQASYQSRNNLQSAESWGPFQYDRKSFRSHKRTHSITPHPLHNQSGGYGNAWPYRARPFQF